jgi:hypothetical protein
MPAADPHDDGYGGDIVVSQERITTLRRLIEAKKSPKKFIKEAEGILNLRKARAKKVVKPKLGKNMACKTSKGKHGVFGETYKPPAGNAGKGVRTKEAFGRRLAGFKTATEAAPPGREEQVRKLKKKKGISNPFAVAWASYNKSHGKG